jgi:hypothetical protein
MKAAAAAHHRAVQYRQHHRRTCRDAVRNKKLPAVCTRCCSVKRGTQQSKNQAKRTTNEGDMVNNRWGLLLLRVPAQANSTLDGRAATQQLTENLQSFAQDAAASKEQSNGPRIRKNGQGMTKLWPQTDEVFYCCDARAERTHCRA